ncbi:MAG TPA: biosynthetic arginine decarboxylase [Candidatus Polarisedimenticolaceae bacterium]|nr:biosynthetic arginine decarboxylase [Candidatus Polarisedimenticolaceae bacterium]
MNVSATERFTVGHAMELYGLSNWSHGYFSVGNDGHLLVTPERDPARAIDVLAVVQDLARRGMNSPLLLRFPQLLEAQVHRLGKAFAQAIEEYRYPERYLPVFPIKVNQRKWVVEALLNSGREHGLGLEVGSRPELMAAAALPTAPDSLIVCNGFKDKQYLASAALATRLGKQVVVVIEKPFEAASIIEQAAQEGEPLPMIGLRIRLQARGSGLWEKSGGCASKFGLTTLQLLRTLETLADAGLQSRVALLHFHIGSQITEIRKIKNAVQEAGRIYAKLRKMGIDIRYLDVGGGLGIDYDGSNTSSDASVNYSVQEYANDIVFGIKEVCQQEQVPPPVIVSESGRWLTAYHAMLVTDVRATVSGVEPRPPELTGREPQVVQDLAEVARIISVKNYRESYHDAIEYRDQMYSLFNLGMLGLEERAKGETLFWSVAHKAVRFSKTAKFMADEFVELETKLHDKYICNFSVFQSLPDHWALDQLFPVMPIHRLNESPTCKATLADITCDSDGEVEKFVDLKDIKDAIELHELLPDEPYYLGFLLIGAYQDTMGDLHNLFGRVHEAEVILDPTGRPVVLNSWKGEPAAETLRYFGYVEEELVGNIDARLREKVLRGQLGREESEQLAAEYRERLRHYTYLGS